MVTDRWFATRRTLYELLHTNPDWSNRQFATALTVSPDWVRIWKQRIGSPPHPDPDVVCQSQSRARKTPPPAWSDRVIERILTLRQELATQFHRTVGAKTIIAYLQRDPDLANDRIPRSPTTINRILRDHQLLFDPPTRQRQPRTPCPPMQEIEIDFTDVTSIPPDPDGKRQHAAEAFMWVDAGTSIPVAARISTDFHMVSVIRTTASILQQIGLPARIRMDCDVRLVSNNRLADFPSPFQRLLLNLGIQVEVCPPHRPDLKPFVERFHKNYKGESVYPNWPTTEAEAQAQVDAYCDWYRTERPHQGRACGNRPPAEAFPELPVLPAVPAQVDADGWLQQIDGWTFVRRVNAQGKLVLDGATYTAGIAYAGQELAVQVDAAARELVFIQRERVVKRVTLKRLLGGMMPFEQLVEALCGLAERETKRLKQRRTKRRR
ncbi:integrase core domain-containing protein [Herpetosiphon giganteus]|uniref:integrase core domain-containing protein n=2 Tax=Herpetosiphon TaxID=64 RepID=UPI001EF7FA62|nr:integrase core domain-containing protein [Herpetosiphon giganteus]MBM7846414.1 transposase InsO family protein [Herpetosiphon giganteus]